MEEKVIIVGGGPAGLLAADLLTKAGRQVLVLEARDRIGGRVHSITDSAGNMLELGAEFIHGRLPQTLQLLQDAGLETTTAGGQWVQISAGESGGNEEGEHWPEFLRKLGGLREDCSLQAFLDKHFADEKYTAVKSRAIAFAEGYDSADATRVSAQALFAEWQAGDEEQLRIPRGYTALMDFLAARITAAGNEILLSHTVSRIETTSSRVLVQAGDRSFSASHVILAVPLSMLQQSAIDGITGMDPAYDSALRTLAMGDVIKFLFRFRTPFWNEIHPGLGFLLSAAEVPTWWTQSPVESTVLTGWMAGRNARAHAGLRDGQLRDIGLRSLAQLFSRPLEQIAEALEESHIANWSADPLTRGSYAYGTVGGKAAQEVLDQPLAGRIWFAGEYRYEGTAMGTVEAALCSGRDTARNVLAAG